MQVNEVTTPSQLRRFINLPYRLYRNHPYWVPPLRIDIKTQLSPDKHPYYRYASHALFLATRNGRDVGRIAVFHNRKHNSVYQENVGMFGYLEMEEDFEIAAALMETAAGWLHPYDAVEIRGPYNPDINGTIGMLLDAYDSPPMIMMPYNFPYYPEFLDRLGFEKIKDVLAYEMHAPVELPRRIREHVKKMEEQGRFTIRKPDMRHFWREVELVKEVYNKAWAENWGALWMDDQEFEHIAKDLKLILDPDLLFIAEADGALAGFSLTLPNINSALAHIPAGRLFPTGLLKLLWYKRRITSVRVFTLGVLKEFRHMGIDAAFYLRTFEDGLAKGYRHGEMSWVLEDNGPMNHALQKLGAEVAKTYRLYGKVIRSPLEEILTLDEQEELTPTA